MPSYSHATVAGHLGRAPEIKEVSGSTVCEFNLAVNDPYRKDDPPSWFKISVWGKQAEACERYLDKGSACLISGQLKVREFTKKDGGKGTSVEIRADRVVFLGGSGEGEGRGDGGSRAPRPTPPASNAPDDDLPF